MQCRKKPSLLFIGFALFWVFCSSQAEVKCKNAISMSCVSSLYFFELLHIQSYTSLPSTRNADAERHGLDLCNSEQQKYAKCGTKITTELLSNKKLERNSSSRHLELLRAVILMLQRITLSENSRLAMHKLKPQSNKSSDLEIVACSQLRK